MVSVILCSSHHHADTFKLGLNCNFYFVFYQYCNCDLICDLFFAVLSCLADEESEYLALCGHG